MKTTLCTADRQPTQLGVSKAPLDIESKVDTECRHSGRRDHCDKRFKGQRPVQWVIETCEVMGSESTLQSVRIQTCCESSGDDVMDRLDHRIAPPFAKRRGRERTERGCPGLIAPRRNAHPPMSKGPAAFLTLKGKLKGNYMAHYTMSFVGVYRHSPSYYCRDSTINQKGVLV